MTDTDRINELQLRVAEMIFVAEERTREAARLWDRVADLQTELVDSLEGGTIEHEIASRGIVDARQSANRIWLALGGKIVSDIEDDKDDTDPSGNGAA